MRTTWLLGSLLFMACGGGGSGATPDAGGGDGPSPGVDSDLLPPTDLARLRTLLEALPVAADDDARDALVDTFLAEVSYGGGFPIRDEGVLAVVARQAAPLTVAGDFNAWSTTANPLTQAVPGYAFEAAIIDDVTTSGRSGYKLVDVGGGFHADPVARRYDYDENGELSLVDDGGTTHLQRWPDFDGGTTLAPRTVRVLVPAGHDAPGARFPVIYAHDGQNLFAPDAPFGGWRVREAAAGAAPCFIVGIDNTVDRLDEYTHVADDLGGGSVGGRAAEYLALLDAVRDHMGARYVLGVGPTQTAIMGSSLGGLVSIFAASRQPDVYGTAISLSGTMGWGRFGASGPTIGEVLSAEPPTGLTIYLDSGGAAAAGCDAPGQDNYCENIALADTLRGLGWVDEDTLYYRHTEGATHDEAAWAARLPSILTTVFPGPR